MWDGLFKIYQTTGVGGLWRGADAAVIRTTVGSATQLTTYSFSKQLVRSSGLLPPDARVATEAGAAMVSGVAVAAAMNPFDVISTRLYNQNPKAPLYAGCVARPRATRVQREAALTPTDSRAECGPEGRRRRGRPFDCLVRIVKAEGPMGLFKGLGAHYLRMGPHTFFTMIFWEQIKRWMQS